MVPFCPAIAPLRPSVQKTARLVSIGMHSAALPTLPVPNGIARYICAPRRRYIRPTPVPRDTLHIRCHRPGAAPLLDLRPLTSPTADPSTEYPRHALAGPNGTGRHNRLRRGSWFVAMLCILRRASSRRLLPILPIPWLTPNLCSLTVRTRLSCRSPALCHVVNPIPASQRRRGGTATPIATSPPVSGPREQRGLG